MGETIHDALATRCTVPVSLEPFEGEGRTGTVAQEPFEPCTVTARDMDRGIDAEPAGGLPREHVIGDVPFEQAVAVEVTEHAVAHGVLEFAAGPWPRALLYQLSLSFHEGQPNISVILLRITMPMSNVRCKLRGERESLTAEAHGLGV